MERRTFLKSAGALGLAAALGPKAFAQGAPEKAKVTLGVGGKPLLYYLPLTIAERKGFFKEQGLEVEINDFGGGAKSLQALIGGSVDVVTGAYEHTIRMQAKGQDVVAVTELGRFPAIVIAVKKDKAGQIKSAADFKGLKIGVTAPGSSTALTAQYAMVKAGLKPSDAAIIGVGSGASGVAAMKKGEIDVISHLDPVIAKLEADGDIQILIDTRTEAGTRELFGGSNPAATLYTKKDFIEKNPQTTQRLVNAFVKTLKWLETAKPEDVAATVPEEYYLGDKPLYLKAVQNSLESYSRSGIIPMIGMQSVLDMLRQLDPELKDAKVDLAATFDDRFVRQAAM
ncbi:MAG: ABC transporter substrate-binding protein [Microvirga sp.]|jgi:NitT/TauT family transport system substrate-binding protein|uniref:Transporter substrate-binding domain-containing protein n=1 Tax=Microvirga tunisiensis TaxID=2108360 RepID=A0A5N7MD01_9HYPH|nr:ABC transporter substrate-binding protein [Microvirga tunisiensis]MPR06426.1 transporter substrate-binding domain-containing protein [Microvirga tunisiensis]MPR24548.1 transporter substrate-binding domain-containing protein [Microvirga tunisiensis]